MDSWSSVIVPSPAETDNIETHGQKAVTLVYVIRVTPCVLP